MLTSEIQTVIPVLFTVIVIMTIVATLEGMAINILIKKLEEKNTALIKLLSTRDEQRRIENSREEMHKKYMSLAAKQAEEMEKHRNS